MQKAKLAALEGAFFGTINKIRHLKKYSKTKQTVAKR